MKKFILISMLLVAFAFRLKSEETKHDSLLIEKTSIIVPMAQTQDSIILRNGKIIIGTVKEIGTSEIKYSTPEYKADLLFSIAIKDVLKVAFSDGKTKLFDIQPELSENIEQNSMELFKIQKKNAIKIDFLGLANNMLSLTYERCLKPARALEFSLGFVGLGVAEKDDNASGILFRGGYKLTRSPEFYIKGMRYAHIMKGPYLKFEFDFASYSIESYNYSYLEPGKYTLTKWAFLMVFGKQWVYNDNFVVDLYSGIGLGRNNLEDIDFSFPYGFSTFGKEFPIAFSFGLRFGFLLK